MKMKLMDEIIYKNPNVVQLLFTVGRKCDLSQGNDSKE